MTSRGAEPAAVDVSIDVVIPTTGASTWGGLAGRRNAPRIVVVVVCDERGPRITRFVAGGGRSCLQARSPRCGGSDQLLVELDSTVQLAVEVAVQSDDLGCSANEPRAEVTVAAQRDDR